MWALNTRPKPIAPFPISTRNPASQYTLSQVPGKPLSPDLEVEGDDFGSASLEVAVCVQPERHTLQPGRPKLYAHPAAENPEALNPNPRTLYPS